MSGLDGQTLAALVCVAVAVVVLGRWTVLWWRGQSAGGCGSCGTGCGTTRAAEPARLKVSLPVIDAPVIDGPVIDGPELEEPTKSK